MVRLPRGNSYLIRDAFDGWLVAIAGFFLLPWTALTYATMWTISLDRVSGWEWAFVGVGLLIDAWALVRVLPAMTARGVKRNRAQPGRLERAGLDLRTAKWIARRFLHVAVADLRRTVRRRRRRLVADCAERGV